MTLQAGLIEKEDIIIDAKSGVSGAGRSAKQNLLYTEIAEGINCYGVGSHRHMPEIEQVSTQFPPSPSMYAGKNCSVCPFTDASRCPSRRSLICRRRRQQVGGAQRRADTEHMQRLCGRVSGRFLEGHTSWEYLMAMPGMQGLSESAGSAVRVSFTPTLMPMSRGMQSTIYVKLANGVSVDDLRSHLQVDPERSTHAVMLL